MADTTFVMNPQVDVVDRSIFWISAELINKKAALGEGKYIAGWQKGIAAIFLCDGKKAIHFFHEG